MTEVWQPIFGGVYSVSNFGQVRKELTRNGPRMLSQETNWGYKRVSIQFGSERKHFRVHRLVASAFIPNPNELPQINHIDGNKTNNHVTNLEWCTQSHNRRHALTNGLYHPPSGINHYAYGTHAAVIVHYLAQPQDKPAKHFIGRNAIRDARTYAAGGPISRILLPNGNGRIHRKAPINPHD